MRPLTKKEKQYFIILLGMAFVFLNLLGFTYYTKNQQNLQDTLNSNRLKRVDAQAFLNEEKLWKQRKEWLQANQPKFSSPGDAQSTLKDKVLKSAQSNHITISNPQQLMTEKGENPLFEEAILQEIKATGTLESLIRWLTELQQPEQFISITSLSLHSTADPNIVECELKTSLCYNFYK
jgi:hypothetical protein